VIALFAAVTLLLFYILERAIKMRPNKVTSEK
jgi:hypothetical protein